jgi:pimeloyl-ACP methyl ester carboxylesterase
MTWGTSLGGLIAATVAERNPKTVAGVLADCAPLMGPQQAFSGAMTVLYTWKSTIAPTLKVANYESYTQALTDLGTVLTVLGGYPAKTGVNSALGFPIAQSNMLGALMAGLPTKSTVYDGQTVNPAFATLGTLAALSGGYSPASAGASTAAAMLQNVGAAAALGILGRYELEQRVRTISGMAATDSANFNDNVNVQYGELLSREQRGEFGDTLNAGAVNLNGMLNKIDATKGNSALRFPANPVAVKIVRALPAPTGVYTSPTVLLTTAYDTVVAPGNTFDYYAKLMASAKKAGSLAKVAQYYTMPVEDGYTKFAAGGKSPDAAASAAANVSGVGHCAFSAGNWGAVTKSVATLNALTTATTQQQIKAAKAIGYGGPAVNGDGFYVPDALKRPGVTTS